MQHTADADVALLSNEFTIEQLKKHLGAPKITLFQTFGFLNDSFEYRVVYNNEQVDLFLNYDFNSTHRQYGYYLAQHKIRFVSLFIRYVYRMLFKPINFSRRFSYKFDDYCSGEIYNYKYMIPCEIVKYLNVEYGAYDNWFMPDPLDYTWKNMEHYGRWPDEQWPSVHKVYTYDGSLNINDTIFHLNRVTNFNMTLEKYVTLLNNSKIHELLTL